MKNEIDNEVREVNNQFSERPIHVKQLKDKVAKIVIQMNTFEDEANDVLVNAVYAEKLIQYGMDIVKIIIVLIRVLTKRSVYSKIIATNVLSKFQNKHLKV